MTFSWAKHQFTVSRLLEDNHYLVHHVPNNHTNLFHPFDVLVNKGANSFLSNKYQDWYTSQVSKKLDIGVKPHDVSRYY